MSEIVKELEKIEAKLEARLEESTKQVQEEGTANLKTREDVKALAQDFAGIMKDLTQVKGEVTDLAQKSAGVATEKKEAKTFGQEFAESKAFENFMSGQSTKAKVEMKNTIVNSGNETSRHEQLPGLVEGAFRMLRVMPTVLSGSVGSNVIYYSQEAGWTNGAAPQAGEGVAKAESTLTFEEKTTTIQTIAHKIKVSKQALDDSTYLSSYIDRRMRHGVMNATENQVINGDGTGQNFEGWLKVGNNTVVSPTGLIDAYGLANQMKITIIAADYEPSFYYFNPQDWSTLETTRRGTGDGAFIAASGAVSYVNNGLTPLLWGLPVVLSNNIPQGTFVCKSFEASQYFDRENVVIEMFEQDEDNVSKNLLTVRGENRGAQAIYRPEAITTGVIAGPYV